ncbi:hypothetical protein [Pseudomonas sp. MH9.3]|uniref:hypothetical protein n=1 Tax=Pseudomonas sp. MH9.3 TaxID=3048630 RepID=UPI002AC93497|nr:hypothetical protein [Pseudomonas sp. MH9.3]MEB0108261.1 hypothetical protein [Pseudomonas sp. MH9.3]WPX80461.1 hypothetical protein RHM60_04925 [Pseudomonas sp. MH9.3]WQG57605.1 hypothetical protein RHM66_21900 [Pseudomonas sp. RTB3]
MNEEQVSEVESLVKELAEKSGTDFNAAFKKVMGVARYHAIDVVPWGKMADFDSHRVKKG